MSSSSPTSLGEVMARVFWMFVGPAILALLLFTITRNAQGWFTPPSIAFPAVAIAVMAARWRDPRNSDGEPSSPADLRGYLIRAVGITFVAWIVANLAGIHWLNA